MDPAPLRRFGLFLYGAAMLGLGIQAALYRDFSLGNVPLPPWVPLAVALSYVTALVLVAGGAALAVGRPVRAAGLAIGGTLIGWLVILHGRRLVLETGNPGVWISAFEAAVLAGAALLLSGEPRVSRLGRALFGVSFFVFGASHFLYAPFVSQLIPAFIPWRLFLAWFTGLAHVAAGLAFLMSIRQRLAATLLGIMFGSWVLLLHVPRVVAGHGDRDGWTSLLIAVALCGAGFGLRDPRGGPESVAAGDHRS